MVRFQEMAKYGRASGVDFGPVDIVKYADPSVLKACKSADQIGQH